MSSEENPEPPSLIFRLNDDGEGPELLKEAFFERGWIEFDEDIHEDHEWNMWWKTSRFRTSDYNQLYPWQRVNHCPKATGITRKDCLARLLKLQQALHGSAYSFAPQSFILPNDYRRFTQEFSAHDERRKTTPLFDQKEFGDFVKENIVCWICKPADMSRGRGISIIRELSELQYDTNSIVQQYITHPYLIHGHKFDMRLYVVVVSYHPLRIYLYNDGLVRFSCEKYDLSALGNVYAHLTNTSINKYSTSYNVDKAGIGHGSKWTLKQFRHYLHQNHVDDTEMWWKIISIVNLTIIPQVSEVPKTANCFELYGFDILIDRDLKPWLLEVNFSPSLNNDCSADVIKKEMLSDLIELMQYKTQDNLHGKDPYQAKVMMSSSNARYGNMSSRIAPRRPQSMLPRLPKIFSRYTPGKSTAQPDGDRGGRVCASVAYDSSEACGSEPGDEEEELSSHYHNPRSILSCSLSQLNIPMSSLINTPAVSPVKRQQSMLRERMSDGPVLPKKLSQQPSSLVTPRLRARAALRPTTQAQNIRPKCYNKPWRQDSGPLRIQRIDSASQKTKEELGSVVGGFHRIYPFNKLTSARELSPRQMVIETHQMIKSKLGQSSSPHKSTSLSNVTKTSVAVNIQTPFPLLSSVS